MFARWGLIVALLAGAGCAKEVYVPVETKLALPDRPAECGPAPALPRMTPFPREPVALHALCPGVESALQCVNLVWAQHRLAIKAAERRRRAREAVCEAYWTRVSKM